MQFPSSELTVFSANRRILSHYTLEWLLRCSKYSGNKPTLPVYARGEDLLVQIPPPEGVTLPSSLANVLSKLTGAGFLRLWSGPTDQVVEKPEENDTDIREMHPEIIRKGELDETDKVRLSTILACMKSSNCSEIEVSVSGAGDSGEAEIQLSGEDRKAIAPIAGLLHEMSEEMASEEGLWRDCGGGSGNVTFLVEDDGGLRVECLMAFADGGNHSDPEGTYYILDAPSPDRAASLDIAA